MKIQSVREFAIKEHGEVQTFKPGIVIELAEEKARRLLRAGVAVLAPPTEHTEKDNDQSLLIQWRTKTGREIYLITSERIRRMAPGGKAVFSIDELSQVRGLPDEQVDAIITTKENFPGAIIEEQANEQTIQ